MLAAIAEGTTKLENYSTGADCQSTLACVRALGAVIDNRDGVISIQGRGLDGLREPADMLDAGNSGSTIRMLSEFSPRRRLNPASAATSRSRGAPCSASSIRCVNGRVLGCSRRSFSRRSPFTEASFIPSNTLFPVASAQVKSCVLLAGLYADGRTTVHEPVRTRDHTELALREFGADVEVLKRSITIIGRPHLQARTLRVPGDLSSAAFFSSRRPHRP